MRALFSPEIFPAGGVKGLSKKTEEGKIMMLMKIPPVVECWPNYWDCRSIKNNDEEEEAMGNGEGILEWSAHWCFIGD